MPVAQPGVTLFKYYLAVLKHFGKAAPQLEDPSCESFVSGITTEPRYQYSLKKSTLLGGLCC